MHTITYLRVWGSIRTFQMSAAPPVCMILGLIIKTAQATSVRGNESHCNAVYMFVSGVHSILSTCHQCHFSVQPPLVIIPQLTGWV